MARQRGVYDAIDAGLDRTKKIQDIELGARKYNLSVQKEDREAQGQTETQNLNQEKFDFQRHHEAAQDHLAEQRANFQNAVDYLKTVTESYNLQQETLKANAAADFIRFYSEVDKFDPNRDAKIAKLTGAFPEARMNAQVNAIVDRDDKELATLPYKTTAADLQLDKDRAWLTEYNKNKASMFGQDEDPNQKQLADLISARVLKQERDRQSNIMGTGQPTPPVPAPGSPEAAAAIGGTPAAPATPPPAAAVPPASTPKEQQQTDWANTQVPTLGEPSAQPSAAPAATPPPNPDDEARARAYLDNAL